jgi:hypothetical protein
VVFPQARGRSADVEAEPAPAATATAAGPRLPPAEPLPLAELEAGIDRAVAFFGPRAEGFDGGARSFALTVEGARQCAAVRLRSRAAARRWFNARR